MASRGSNGAYVVAKAMEAGGVSFSDTELVELGFPAMATRWTTAYLRGIRDYNDAFRKNIHRSETVETLAGAFAIKPALFDSMGFMHIHPEGKMNLDSIQDIMRWYVKMGYLSEPVDITRVVDSSFVEAAVARLGAYH